MAFFSLGDFLINSKDVSHLHIETVYLAQEKGYKIKAELLNSDTTLWSKFYEDCQTARTILDGIRQYLKDQEA